MARVKQNITLAMDPRLLKQARAVAVERGMSVSSLLAAELAEIVGRNLTYERAKREALARLDAPFRLGGRIARREELHDRSRQRP